MVLGLLLCMTAAVLPAAMLYFPNLSEIAFSEMLPYFGAMCGIGALAWAGMYLVTRRKGLAAVAAAAWLLVLLNIGRAVPALQTVFPLAGLKIIAPAVLVLLAAAVWGLSKLKEETLRDTARVAALALAAFMLVLAVPRILSLPRKEAPAEETVIDPTPAKDADRPDVYWIIPDEYAGQEQLQRYFHYDNGVFSDQLKELGFSVSGNSYNWGSDTFQILRDILYLKYTDIETTEREAIVADPDAPLWKFFRSLGYRIYEVESAPKFGLKQRISGLEEDHAALTAEGETVANLLLRYSLLYRYEKEIADILLPKQSKKSVREQVQRVLDWTEYCGPLKESAPAFTVIYTRCPHLPIVFARDGGTVPGEHRYEKKDRQYYLDQLIYISAELRDMVSSIIAQDPDAIIVLQSDHGWRTVDNITWRDLGNILNAVYFRGEPFDEIAGRNGLNTWIAVLRRQFHLDIPDVEERRMSNAYREEFRNPEAEDPNGEE